MARIQTVFICSFVLSCSRSRQERERKKVEEEKEEGGGGLADAVGDCADDQLNTGRVNGSLVRVENRRGCARAVRQKKMDIKGTQRAEGRSVGYVRVTTSEATRS